MLINGVNFLIEKTKKKKIGLAVILMSVISKWVMKRREKEDTLRALN
jgi:hypothetical protein